MENHKYVYYGLYLYNLEDGKTVYVLSSKDEVYDRIESFCEQDRKDLKVMIIIKDTPIISRALNAYTEEVYYNDYDCKLHYSFSVETPDEDMSFDSKFFELANFY